MPKTVCIEYDKHRKKEFSKYIKKYEFFYNDYRCNIDKYSDLILWEEIIYFSKLNNCDIIFVSNDNKEDWFNNKEEFRNDLQQEFVDRTNKKIYAYNSKDFLI